MSRLIALAAAFLLGLATLVHGQAAGGIKAYSKYDFVPGEKVMLFDDFASDEVGDFPAGWDTNASGEVVTLEGKPGRWLAFTKGGVFLPVLRADLPEVFTLEFDVLASQPFNYGTSLAVILAAMGDLKQLVSWHGTDNRFTFTLNPGGASSADRRRDGEGEAAVQVQFEPFAATGGAPVHVSVWRQKERVRVYIGGQKVWDLPKGIVPTAKLNALMFYVNEAGPDYQYFISNVRLAVGAPDTRNKLVTGGKWVTLGILFDTNSDRIRGESFGTLKEIAAVLKENPDLAVTIIGHTDSDGEVAANLDLSKRRAASVKNALVTEFGIDAARLETDGRGESEPADSDDTSAGKANNRRVEFVKR